VRELAAGSRSVFERVGARPYLAMLEAAMDVAPLDTVPIPQLRSAPSASARLESAGIE
jgi:hypothetical protein